MFDSVLQPLQPFAREFHRRGKQIHLVGGAVRNLLLGRPVKDYDFTTDALPQEVISYFRKVIPTGLQHGTVTVLFEGQSYEVTTFRVDGGYSDGRRPDGVSFTPSLEEDLRRRDFTVNALALNLVDGTLTDAHGGQADLQARRLRAIGDPGARFDEDALRLLRLFRFASQLDFDVEPATLAAVAPRRAQLGHVSRERIREELAKALAGVAPLRAWGPLTDLGFLDDLWAPLVLRRLTAAESTRLATLAPDLRWPYWLTLVAGVPADRWLPSLKALTFSRDDQEKIVGPARCWAPMAQESEGRIRAKAVLEAWGTRARADLGLDYLAALESVGFWKDEGGLQKELRRVIDAVEPIWLSELAINGQMLLGEGFPAGPGLGAALKSLQRQVWLDPGLNDPTVLKERSRSLR